MKLRTTMLSIHSMAETVRGTKASGRGATGQPYFPTRDNPSAALNPLHLHLQRQTGPKTID